MIRGKKVACVIPARLQSSRFPRKIFAQLGGKSLLQRVFERASQVALFDTVVFAIDSEETAELLRSFSAPYFMTDSTCSCGTERLIELQKRGVIDADIWVNWQADEPFISEAMICDLLQTCDEEGSDIWTLKKRIVNVEEVQNPHIAKLVCDERGYALFFSRSPIPYYRDACSEKEKIFYKHVGLYAYTSAALQKISYEKPCEIEKAEQLEQLRFLSQNLAIRVHETEYEVFGIDLPEHLARAALEIIKTDRVS